MRELFVMAALFIAIAGDPLRAMNVMALPIAFKSPSCEDAAALGSCGSLVLAQTRTPVGRISARPVPSRTLSIIEMAVQMGCNSIRHLGAFMRATVRDIGVKLRRG
jgi:hypothetical protein